METTPTIAAGSPRRESLRARSSDHGSSPVI